MNPAIKLFRLLNKTSFETAEKTFPISEIVKFKNILDTEKKTTEWILWSNYLSNVIQLAWIELNIHDILHKNDRAVIEHLKKELKSLTTNPSYEEIVKFSKQIYDKNSPIRISTFFADSIDEVHFMNDMRYLKIHKHASIGFNEERFTSTLNRLLKKYNIN